MFVLALINSVTGGSLDKGVNKAVISNFIVAEIKCALVILFCLILELAVDNLFLILHSLHMLFFFFFPFSLSLCYLFLSAAFH